MQAKMMNLSLVMMGLVLGIAIDSASSQSVPDPIFARGCRAQRGQFPHETYCHQYYNCWDGRATIDDCPGKLQFNPVISACDYPEAVNCLARIRIPDPAITGDGRCLKQFGIFPDPTDCTAFYECSHGRSYRQVCPYYTAFDERYLVCVHAYDVDCGGRGGVYGTLAPPLFKIPDGGISAQIGLPPVGSGSAASGWDRRAHQGSASSGFGSQSPSPFKGSTLATSIRRSGASTSPSSSLVGPIISGSLLDNARGTESQGVDGIRIPNIIPIIPGSLESNIPGSRSHASNIPGSRSPGSSIPDDGRHGSNIPGSRSPGTNIPDGGRHGSNIPSRGHGSNIPGSRSPGSSIPDGGRHGSNIPSRGESNIPDSRRQGSNIPDSRSHGSNIPDSRRQGSNIPDSRSHGSNIPDSRRQGSNIPDSRSRGPNIPDSRRQGSNIPDSRSRGSNIPDSRRQGSNIPDSRSQGSNIPDNRRQGSNVPESRSQGSNAPDSRIRGSNIPESRIRGSNIPDSRIHGSSIPDSRIPGSNIPDSRIRGSSIPDSRIHGSNIPDSRILGANVPDSRSDGSSIPDSRIRGSNIQDSRIHGSNIPDRSHGSQIPDGGRHGSIPISGSQRSISGSRINDFNTPASINQGSNIHAIGSPITNIPGSHGSSILTTGSRDSNIPERRNQIPVAALESGTHGPGGSFGVEIGSQSPHLSGSVSHLPHIPGTVSSGSNTLESGNQGLLSPEISIPTPISPRIDGTVKDLRIQGISGTGSASRGAGSGNRASVGTVGSDGFGNVNRGSGTSGGGTRGSSRTGSGNRGSVGSTSGNRNVGGIRSSPGGSRVGTGSNNRGAAVGGGSREPPVAGIRGPTGGGSRDATVSGSRVATGGGNRDATVGGSRGAPGGGNRGVPGSGARGGSRISGSTSSSPSSGSVLKPSGNVPSNEFPGSRIESIGSGDSSAGTQAGITGIVDKEISATDQERQYETPISPEATFRCPQPRGLYPNALDCSKFWLCREYKPSLLKCPTGQLFDLPSLACMNPEKAQCSSISPRT